MTYVIASIFILFGVASILFPGKIVTFNRTMGQRNPGPLSRRPIGGQGMASLQTGTQFAMGFVAIAIGIAALIWRASN